MPSVASPSELTSVLAQPGATVIDLRPASSEEEVSGKFEGVHGALSSVWDREAHSMPLQALPADKFTRHDPSQRALHDLLLPCPLRARECQA